ncbi:MAG: damage-inducible protein DinB [Alphaproteobacteria bacterium]|nr:damage-inducible protein DinB [Alphaproteobacteria bacterium]
MSWLVEHFRAMARNNAWSNHRLLTACAQLSADDFVAPRVGFFPSLQATLNHILKVDGYYIESLEGREDAMERAYAFAPHDTLASLATAQRASDRRLLAYCDGLAASRLEAPVTLRRRDRTPPLETVRRVLPHLFVHQIHHRGQAHAMLSSTTVKPPQLDEFFLLDELPLRRDELRALGLPES